MQAFQVSFWLFRVNDTSVMSIMTLMVQLTCYCLKHGLLQPVESKFDHWRGALLAIIGVGNLLLFFGPGGSLYHVTLTTHYASFAGLMADDPVIDSDEVVTMSSEEVTSKLCSLTRRATTERNKSTVSVMLESYGQQSQLRRQMTGCGCEEDAVTNGVASPLAPRGFPFMPSSRR